MENNIEYEEMLSHICGLLLLLNSSTECDSLLGFRRVVCFSIAQSMSDIEPGWHSMGIDSLPRINENEASHINKTCLTSILSWQTHNFT
jgi:hypothetical protein